MVWYDGQVALQVSTLQCQRTAYSKLAADNEVILTKLAELQGSVAKGTGASGVRPINTELEWETVQKISNRSHRRRYSGHVTVDVDGLLVSTDAARAMLMRYKHSCSSC